MDGELMLCGKCGLDLEEHVRRGNPGDDVARCADGEQYEYRRGDWLQTMSGKRFWFLDPRPEEITLEDIAAGLSNTCRFTGQCKPFYSVAQHCILVAELVQAMGGDVPLVRAALLHDASEAYMSDVPRPLKNLLREYKVIEHGVEAVIERAFHVKLDADQRALIKLCDRFALQLERHALFKDVLTWGTDRELAQHREWLKRWTEWPKRTLPPELAERAFVNAYDHYNTIITFAEASTCPPSTASDSPSPAR